MHTVGQTHAIDFVEVEGLEKRRSAPMLLKVWDGWRIFRMQRLGLLTRYVAICLVAVLVCDLKHKLASTAPLFGSADVDLARDYVERTSTKWTKQTRPIALKFIGCRSVEFIDRFNPAD